MVTKRNSGMSPVMACPYGAGMNYKQIALAMRNQDGSYTDAIKLGLRLLEEHGHTVPNWISPHEEDWDPSSDYRELIYELEEA